MTEIDLVGLGSMLPDCRIAREVALEPGDCLMDRLARCTGIIDMRSCLGVGREAQARAGAGADGTEFARCVLDGEAKRSETRPIA